MTLNITGIYKAIVLITMMLIIGLTNAYSYEDPPPCASWVEEGEEITFNNVRWSSLSDGGGMANGRIFTAGDDITFSVPIEYLQTFYGYDKDQFHYVNPATCLSVGNPLVMFSLKIIEGLAVPATGSFGAQGDSLIWYLPDTPAHVNTLTLTADDKDTPEPEYYMDWEQWASGLFFDDEDVDKSYTNVVIEKHGIIGDHLYLQEDDPESENRYAVIRYELLPDSGWSAEDSWLRMDKTCENDPSIHDEFEMSTSAGEHVYHWYGNYTPTSDDVPHGPNAHQLDPGQYTFRHYLNYDPIDTIYFGDMDAVVNIVDIDMSIGCLDEAEEDTAPGAFIFDSITELTPLRLYHMDEVFCHPDAVLTLRVISGGDKIKIWDNSDRTNLLWDPLNPGANGFVKSRVNSDIFQYGTEIVYIEAIGTSSSMLAGDIILRWAWETDRIYSDIVRLTSVELPPLSCPAMLGARNFRAAEENYDPFPDLGGGAVGGCDETSLASQVFIENCDVNWMPEGGSVDNTVEITARVTSNCITGQFIFELYDVSSEKGYCLNAPNPCPAAGEDSADWKDLQFPEQDGFTLTGNNIATSDATNLKEVTVTVKCYDYGAFGKIKVKFKKDGAGTEYIGKEMVNDIATAPPIEYTKIPFDQNGNDIADCADQDVGPNSTSEATDDNDNRPVGAGVNGDMLTRYEEYRGYVDYDPEDTIYPYDILHYRTDVEKKNVFIYDEYEQGIGYFNLLDYENHIFSSLSIDYLEENISTVPILLPDGSTWYDTNYKKYILDFNRDSHYMPTGFGIFANYAIYLTQRYLVSETSGWTTRYNDTGARCMIPLLFFEYSNTPSSVRNMVVAHELGHAVYLHPTGCPDGHAPMKNCIMDFQYNQNSPQNTFCTTDDYKCMENHKLKSF